MKNNVTIFTVDGKSHYVELTNQEFDILVGAIRQQMIWEFNFNDERIIVNTKYITKLSSYKVE